MKFLDNIKNYFGTRQLNKMLASHKTRNILFCNLNKAKSVGLIASIKNEDDYNKVQTFVKYLKGEVGVRNVQTIAFYNENEEASYLQSKLSFDFFTSEDISWSRKPLKEVCLNFSKEEFDILIDLTDEFLIPLRYILVQSKSSFKVGKYSVENEPYYDFMIDSEHNNFHQFTKEAVRYLSVING